MPCASMGFTAAEQRSFDAQTRLVNDIQAVQERVVDLLNAERNADARRVLVQEAIPIQEAFNRQLADMRNLYQQANLAAQQQAQQTYRQHVFTHAGIRHRGDCPGAADRLVHAAENATEVTADT